MKYLKSISESIKDDYLAKAEIQQEYINKLDKSKTYLKYINKLVVFEHEKKNELNYGTVNRIYLTDNFSTNIYVINITEKNNSPYSTNFRLQDINILKECNSTQEAENYIDMINNSNKFNL